MQAQLTGRLSNFLALCNDMKRTFGATLSSVDANRTVSERNARRAAAVLAAVVVIQAFVRGQQLRNRLPWIIAAAAASWM